MCKWKSRKHGNLDIREHSHKLKRCCGCRCFRFSHQWFLCLFSICISIFFWESLEISFTHTIREKTSLKFQKDIHLELNPSFCWSRGRGSCENQCHQMKSLMSSALTADDGHSSWCTWTDVLPLNVNQASFTGTYPHLLLLSSCPMPPSLHSQTLPCLLSFPFMSPARKHRPMKEEWKRIHCPQINHSSCWHLW